ncbi:MAG TPA: hypothetical protein DCL46_05420, partial [Alcanivorax sp.]|nr:hypothetical protein [Alcanivorax sp.]
WQREGSMGKQTLKFQPVLWAEMAPDIYAGDNCDQREPHWHCHADGDMDSDYLDALELSAATFPAGTKIIVEVPCCPDCGVSADYERRDDGHCECGFDWPAWVEDRFQ